jgi:hypothetical protein
MKSNKILKIISKLEKSKMQNQSIDQLWNFLVILFFTTLFVVFVVGVAKN